MPKGYWIAHVKDIENPDVYKLYVEGAAPAFKRFGARFIARGGRHESLEGADIGQRHVIIEFDSLETAKACYNSPEYQEARKHRAPIATATMVIVEGVE